MAVNLKLALMSLVFLVAFNAINHAQAAVFDVTTHGAKPGADMTAALTSAWKEACAAAGKNQVVVPKGTFQLGPVSLEGPCKGPIEFQNQGTIQAPADPSKFQDFWIQFLHVDGFTLSGAGTFDGQGQTAWKSNICANNLNSCGVLAANLKFSFVTNAVVTGITSLNSKYFHIILLGCKGMRMEKLTITAPADSANTDGIHIGRSSGITITDIKIGTGDDCISLGDGSQDITITKVTCGPGHGISVGSLGRYKDEEPVSGITVTGCTITNAQNGVRIKTWPASPSAGSASGMHFEDITMINVDNPILIDQGYCPHGQCKAQVPSTIKISDVSFKNIRGSTNNVEAIKLACSKSVPCEKVNLQDIDLKFTGSGEAKTICENVKPTISGTQNPPGCTGAAAAAAPA
ncbi:exopolygalacturonase-like [Juglans microcarpa x Juglans regia]|uniref:exopolygalacturonase-like n=1 Tax=Juglans microcarpa x Juglans regia TaxID=2249226 RepID=UPI001B7F236A|nr:exopolygalacturonase-like [Juglans microcarpa x Juglans regia]